MGTLRIGNAEDRAKQRSKWCQQIETIVWCLSHYRWLGFGATVRQWVPAHRKLTMIWDLRKWPDRKYEGSIVNNCKRRSSFARRLFLCEETCQSGKGL